MLSRKISGAKVRHIRETRCLTVAAVARAAGCTPSNIYKIEQGAQQPSSKVYAALKTVLEVDDAELVTEMAGSAS